MTNSIGKFCSVAKKGSLVVPKEIPGYVTPPGEILQENGQRFLFKYTPIIYNISYNLNGGVFNSEHKTTYTVEDSDYIPPSPQKADHKFIQWVPSIIKQGTIGDIAMTAQWKPLAILVPGLFLNSIFTKLAGSKDNIIAIIRSNEFPNSDYINISSSDTPILASFDNGVISIYSDDDIYCNPDMGFAFSKFSLLRDISGLASFKCKTSINISGLFDGCILLADLSPIEDWDCCNFNNAFKNTTALLASRVPLWYRWKVKIIHSTTDEIILKEITEDRIPGEIIYHQSFKGYHPIIDSLEINAADTDYKFMYKKEGV